MRNSIYFFLIFLIFSCNKYSKESNKLSSAKYMIGISANDGGESISLRINSDCDSIFLFKRDFIYSDDRWSYKVIAEIREYFNSDGTTTFKMDSVDGAWGGKSINYELNILLDSKTAQQVRSVIKKHISLDKLFASQSKESGRSVVHFFVVDSSDENKYLQVNYPFDLSYTEISSEFSSLIEDLIKYDNRLKEFLEYKNSLYYY